MTDRDATIGQLDTTDEARCGCGGLLTLIEGWQHCMTSGKPCGYSRLLGFYHWPEERI